MGAHRRVRTLTTNKGFTTMHANQYIAAIAYTARNRRARTMRTMRRQRVRLWCAIALLMLCACYCGALFGALATLGAPWHWLLASGTVALCAFTLAMFALNRVLLLRANIYQRARY